MEKQIKKQINKLVKMNGSHLGFIMQNLRINFPSADAEQFRGYIQEKINAKFNAVPAGDISGRNIRYQ